MFNIKKLRVFYRNIFKINESDFNYLLDIKFNLNKSDLVLNQKLNIHDNLKLLFYLIKYKLCNNIYHAVNVKYFCDLKLFVNKDVLIPRFETELLVNELSKELKLFKEPINLIDIGTGSGAIALAIKNNFKKASITGIDISSSAIKIAKLNAKNNNLNVEFNTLDMHLIKNNYNVIVSNPPYIAKTDKIDLNVYSTEPHTALFAENNGLYFYKVIIETCKKHLQKPGIIAFEIGNKQAEEILSLLDHAFPNSKTKVVKDFNGLDRIIISKIKN